MFSRDSAYTFYHFRKDTDRCGRPGQRQRLVSFWQWDLDRLAKGTTIDGTRYGPVTAELERAKGLYAWANIAIREGKNREVKRLMEHLGLKVARLIRVGFGPFQLGHLRVGEVDEIPSKVWREQLGIPKTKKATR